MKILWKKWIPKENLKRKYYIDKIYEDLEGGLIIELSDEDEEKIILNWDGVVESYMCTEESSRSEMYKNQDLTEWTFFEIESSEYVQWICEQSLGIQQSDKLHHFCIIGINAVIDVVASYTPSIALKTEIPQSNSLTATDF